MSGKRGSSRCQTKRCFYPASNDGGRLWIRKCGSYNVRVNEVYLDEQRHIFLNYIMLIPLSFNNIIGKSAGMQAVYRKILKTDSSVYHSKCRYLTV